MNPTYLGDSYDLVKRFFCRELTLLGYCVSSDPMLTGDWGGNEHDFYRLIGAQPINQMTSTSSRKALFLDPDTGVNAKGGKQHASFSRLAQETENHEIVFAFDQSFSRQSKPEIVMREKLSAMEALGCHAMYYDSHARFLFAAKSRFLLDELESQLLSVGLPPSRIFRIHT